MARSPAAGEATGRDCGIETKAVLDRRAISTGSPLLQVRYSGQDEVLLERRTVESQAAALSHMPIRLKS